MKHLLVFSILFTSLFSWGQLSGRIIEDGRKVTEEIPYQMEMSKTGILVFDIAVDVKGNVTSCKLNKAESTIKSTTYAYKAKNIILMQLKFEKGNGFPTFHQGRVTITGHLPE